MSRRGQNEHMERTAFGDFWALAMGAHDFVNANLFLKIC